MPSRSAVVVLLALALAGCGDAEPRLEPAASGSSSSPSALATSPPAQPTPSAAASATPAPSPTLSAPPSSAAPDPEPAVVAPQDPLSPMPAPESAVPVGQPACRAADLTVVDADTLVLAGHVEEVFVVRTKGPDCQLEGYPTVRLLDARGTPLPVTVARGGSGLTAAPAGPVTLSRDTSVSFVVASGRDGACTEAAEVDVTLPGTSSAIRTTTVLSICDAAAGVSPVQRRADDE